MAIDCLQAMHRSRDESGVESVYSCEHQLETNGVKTLNNIRGNLDNMREDNNSANTTVCIATFGAGNRNLYRSKFYSAQICEHLQIAEGKSVLLLIGHIIKKSCSEGEGSVQN
jgi:hypothetical protein